MVTIVEMAKAEDRYLISQSTDAVQAEIGVFDELRRIQLWICCLSHFSFNHRPSSVFEPNFPAIMSSLMTPVVTPAVLSPQVVTSSATLAPQAPAPPSKRPTHAVAGLAATAALAAVRCRSTRRSGFAGCATVTGLKTMKRSLADAKVVCAGVSFPEGRKLRVAVVGGGPAASFWLIFLGFGLLPT